MEQASRWDRGARIVRYIAGSGGCQTRRQSRSSGRACHTVRLLLVIVTVFPSKGCRVTLPPFYTWTAATARSFNHSSPPFGWLSTSSTRSIHPFDLVVKGVKGGRNERGTIDVWGGAEIPELFYAFDFELDSVESNRFVAREQKSSYWRRERLGSLFSDSWWWNVIVVKMNMTYSI